MYDSKESNLSLRISVWGTRVLSPLGMSLNPETFCGAVSEGKCSPEPIWPETTRAQLPNHTMWLLHHLLHFNHKDRAILAACTKRLRSRLPIAIATDTLQHLAISIIRAQEPITCNLSSFTLRKSIPFQPHLL